MRNMLIVFSLLLLPLMAFAHEDNLTGNDIKNRFELKAELLVFDASGTRLLGRSNLVNSWRPRVIEGKAEIERSWGSLHIHDRHFFIHHVWTVQDDGSIKVSIEEFAKQEEYKKPDGTTDTRFAGSIKKSDFVLENMGQVNWISPKSTEKERYVVQFTPFINSESQAQPLAQLPISGTDIQVIDNEGAVWLEHNNVSGKYIGYTTRKGSLFLSYYPFKGATELGVAAGNKMEVKLSGTRVVTLTSQSAFVPNDVRATVYGVYRPDRKSPGLDHTGTFSTNTEKSIVEASQSPSEF